MDDLTDFWMHTVTVTPADTADGQVDEYGRPVKAAPVTVTGFVQESTHWVRGRDGADVQAIATVTLPLDAPHFGTGSTMTLPSGQTGTVFTVAVADGYALDLPSHTTYTLT
ncbi:hypothetical protein [Actinomyces urogenitalis]|uniref:hypothetical protein n=1 Tax=Actinomyces urogenitalis TaxID=103621 RepID=UPI001898B67C|nr:hypothetical protein [Actinomyces urogenitalis]MDU0864421.1 hypothetical protein [Actinomyces urogenitalis]MDU0874967.1 hypothetical protein [Actinomyces urogenitalis]MDU1565362.1 hypothetical protein [Actinomyces urogenitalis]MDU1640605.1 hypothetical protein [Actinomyces urogenitalis]MDU5874560.1 hypothetical protein [Actinomyces urogenitalis]